MLSGFLAVIVGYCAFVWGFNKGADALGVSGEPIYTTTLQETFTPQTTNDSLALQDTQSPQVTLHRIFLQGN